MLESIPGGRLVSSEWWLSCLSELADHAAFLAAGYPPEVAAFATANSPVGGGEGAVEGIFFGGGAGLLIDQLIGGIAIAVFVAVTSGIMFGGLRAAGVFRVSEEEELAGLDLSEHGTPGYDLGTFDATPSTQVLS